MAGSLKARYDQLDTDRLQFLDRARRCSVLTVPTLFPPQGATSGYRFPTPWQSMGARCVNNLAAKLLLALFPPSAPFFRLVIDDFTLEKMTQQKGMRADVEKALNKIERSVSMEIETTTSRPALFEALKQLVVGGNALIHVTPENKIRVHKLHSYVVKRDPAGNPLEIIIKECLSATELPKATLDFLGTKGTADTDDGSLNKVEDDIELYTGFVLQPNGPTMQWRIWQEIDGRRLPGAGFAPHDKCPARPLRWTAVEGEDYGRGMVEEYLGDFQSLEGLQKAIVQGAAAAAKVLFLVKPNSTTKKDVVAKSESGDVHSGNAEDVTVLQMQKFNDFKVALDTRNDIMQALSFAFMLNTAIQRSGERVTAEEIRFMAQELESSLGGVYSTMSQDLQLPLVTLLMNSMERQQRLPTLPKGIVKPAITTGIEAIGRGNDISRMQGLMQDLAPLGPEVIAEYMNVGDYIKRAGTARQIDCEGLIRSEQEVQQNRQQKQMAEMAQRAAPNAVNQIGSAMQAQQGTPNG